MVTQYKRGRQVEYWCRDQLLEDGFHTVIRSAGSKGVFDLCAVGDHAIKLVQVKRVAGKRPRAFADDLAAMCEVKTPECCQKELWIFYDEHKSWMILPANYEGGK